jgi:hypothetical protein
LKNKCITILLLLSISLISFYKIGIYFQFKMYQTEIAALLCVQKDIPNNKCQGNCLLIKKIKATERQEDKYFPQQLKQLFDVLYCIDISAIKFYLHFVPSKTDVTYVSYKETYRFLYLFALLKPPIVKI